MNGVHFWEISKPVWGYRNVSSVISSASDYICHPKQVISALSYLHLYIWTVKVEATLQLVFTTKSSREILLLNETATAPTLLCQHQQRLPNCQGWPLQVGGWRDSHRPRWGHLSAHPGHVEKHAGEVLAWGNSHVISCTSWNYTSSALDWSAIKGQKQNCIWANRPGAEFNISHSLLCFPCTGKPPSYKPVGPKLT